MKKLPTLLCSALLFSSNSYAAMVTLTGNDVSFTYDDSTLFGSATVIGNSISFQPTSFLASASNLDGAVTISETLNITVEAITANYDMSSFLLCEAGDYTTDGSSTRVTASGRLQISSNTTTCPLLGCFESDIFNFIDDSDNLGITTEWDGTASVDLADNTNGWTSDTAVVLQIQNNLSATSTELGDAAWIQKKFGAVGVTVNPVPVPAAVWLFGSGLIGLAAMARRKRS